MEYLTLILYALLGTLVAATLALIPALHVYNVAALLVLASLRFSNFVDGDALAMLLLGLVIGYAIVNAVSQTHQARQANNTARLPFGLV
jgi:TctA family transporter